MGGAHAEMPRCGVRYVADMTGPLSGFTVVEACQMVAGPLAGTHLADLGAEVIKIENPSGGDRMRFLGDRVGDISALWALTNRGKRAVTLDLQQAEGVELLKTLVAKADVFIQNFRPGVAERLGIGEPELRAVNPALVYVSVSGFGDTGPNVDQKSYDYVIQALSGMAALQTDPTTGLPTLVRNVVIDKTTAGYATQSILAALLARERGAGGQHIRLSMIDVAVSFLWPDGMMKDTFLDPTEVTPGGMLADDYLVRATLDGYITFVATSGRQFPALCGALGTSWETDPRFLTLADRQANATELNALVAEELLRWKGAELVDRLHAFDVPCALINPLDQVHLDRQVIHNGILVEHDRPHLGPVREPRPPADFSVTPVALGRHAPRPDEHTDEVLAEFGITTESLDDLRSRGVIGTRRPSAHQVSR